MDTTMQMKLANIHIRLAHFSVKHKLIISLYLPQMIHFSDILFISHSFYYITLYSTMLFQSECTNISHKKISVDLLLCLSTLKQRSINTSVMFIWNMVNSLTHNILNNKFNMIFQVIISSTIFLNMFDL